MTTVFDQVQKGATATNTEADLKECLPFRRHDPPSECEVSISQMTWDNYAGNFGKSPLSPPTSASPLLLFHMCGGTPSQQRPAGFENLLLDKWQVLCRASRRPVLKCAKWVELSTRR